MAFEAVVPNSLKQKQAGRSAPPATIFCYLAASRMSTKKCAAALFAFAVAAFCAIAAPPSGAADPGGDLAPHALANSSSLYLREASSAEIRWQPWSDASF